MTLDQCRIESERKLRKLYPFGEAKWMTRIIFEKVKGYTPVDMAIKANQALSDFIVEKVDSVVDRLLKHEPIQYVFGEARFYGMTLKVSPSVLIPRPETEELVDMIVADAGGKSDLRVLDVCTGSGCIAIALARNLRFPTVTATDISRRALDVAKENVELTHTAVELQCVDALTMHDPTPQSYDIIVSNPPYIAQKERQSMDLNVLDYEPAEALFVPDNAPLLFYDAIGRYARTALSAGGRLYFEVNPVYSAELANQMEQSGWKNVELHRDMQKQIRFLTAINPGQ